MISEMSLYPEEELTDEALEEISELLSSLVGRRNNVGTTCNANCVTLSMFENFKKEFAESLKQEIDNLTNELSSKVEVNCNFSQSRIYHLENELSISISQVDTLSCALEKERNERYELAKTFSESVKKFTGVIEELRFKSSVLEERISEITSRQLSSLIPTSLSHELRNEVFRLQNQLSNSIQEGFMEWNGTQSKLQEEVQRNQQGVDNLNRQVTQPPPATPQNGSMDYLTVFQPEIEDISPASTPTPADDPPVLQSPASPRAVAASTALLELVENYRRPVIESSNQVSVITYFTTKDEKDDYMIFDDNTPPNEEDASLPVGSSMSPNYIHSAETSHGIDGNRPLFCVCGLKHSSRTTLYGHIRYHTVEKRFICKLCSRRFCSASSLKQHLVRVHNKI